MENSNNSNIKNILNSDLLEQIQNFIDPNQVFIKEDIKIIKNNIKNIPLDENEQKLILFHIEKDIINNFNDCGEFKINEENLDLHEYICDIRNQCQEYYYRNSIKNNFFYMSPYIKNFYKSFENISKDDGFMEIPGSINQIEYIKHFTLNDIFLHNSVLDLNFHKNYKDIIYIYSCFDRIASLFFMLNTNDNNHLEKNIYFSKDMLKNNENNYLQNKTIIEKTDYFIKSKLFKDFKKIRNYVTHNHTDPMEQYYVNLYSFVGLFLLTYYVKEILIKYYDK